MHYRINNDMAFFTIAIRKYSYQHRAYGYSGHVAVSHGRGSQGAGMVVFPQSSTGHWNTKINNTTIHDTFI